MDNPNKNMTEAKKPNPIINASAIGKPSPIITTTSVEPEEFQEYMSAGCTASVPAGARKIYLVVATLMAAFAGGIVFALFKLLDL